MLKTPFAGLTQLDPEEPLSLDDFSFQAENPMRIDRLLEVGAVTHRHDAHAALANPSAAPTADSFVGSGTIPGDTTIEFGYTLIDADGGETEVSPIDAVTTPPQIGAPSGAITATADYTAGQLKPATYYYGRTFVDGGGGETPLGAIRAVDVEPGHANARVLLAGLSGGMVAVGAAGWKLYRARDGGNFTYLASGSGNTLTDDGTLCIDCDQNPPEFNTTQSFNRVHVTLPVRPADAVEWRLYGTVQSGIWDLFSYVASGSGSAVATVVLPSFTPTRGRPPARSTALRGASQIDPDTELFDWHWLRPVANKAALPSGAASGDARVTLNDGAMYVNIAGEWMRPPEEPPLIGSANASGSAAIPDAGQVSVPIVVASGGRIEDVDLSVWIEHPNLGDLEVYLQHPDGSEVLLADNRGGAGDGYGNASAASARAVLSDQADRVLTDGPIANRYLGRWRPDNRLSAFRGKYAKGTWKLRVVDTTASNTGTVHVASLHLTTRRTRESHTYSLTGGVASGAYAGFFVALSPYASGRIVKVRHQMGSGSATVSLQKNGVDIAEYDDMAVGGVATNALGATDVSNDDKIRINISAVTGSPSDMEMTIHVEVAPPP